MLKFLCVVCLLILPVCILNGQNKKDSTVIAGELKVKEYYSERGEPGYSPVENVIDYRMLGTIGIVYTGAAIPFHNYFLKKDKFSGRAVWTQASSSLSVFQGAGDFYSLNLAAHLFSGAYEAAGMQPEPSAWWSGLTSFAFNLALDTELNGGKISARKTAYETAGTLFYLGQYYYPFLKNFMPKFSYHPYQGSRFEDIMYDQSAQAYWISMRFRNFLPGDLSSYVPSWLNIAAGIKKHANKFEKEQIELYIALDPDFEQLPLYGSGWQFVKNTLNYFHLPMPGVRITPKAAVFLFCF